MLLCDIFYTSIYQVFSLWIFSILKMVRLNELFLKPLFESKNSLFSNSKLVFASALNQVVIVTSPDRG